MLETLNTIGHAAILKRRKVALLCSQKCPGAWGRVADGMDLFYAPDMEMRDAVNVLLLAA